MSAVEEFVQRPRHLAHTAARSERLPRSKVVLRKKVSSGYTVAPDGRLVAVRQANVPGIENQINVVPHWFEDLKKEAQK